MNGVSWHIWVPEVVNGNGQLMVTEIVLTDGLAKERCDGSERRTNLGEQCSNQGRRAGRRPVTQREWRSVSSGEKCEEPVVIG